ncbi:MAG: holo-ACP synthase [Chitinispirillales bacterium]|jgi:holo-[acyl-carrier-protein] synthase|nr:holo-ACP synthase [Chitinispirillales bacterium]
MAIKGVGVDIAEIYRISNIIARYGDKFINRIYTPAEAGFCARAGSPERHFAGRWAAKEAFYKALPEALQRFSSWQSIQILSGAGGRPIVDVCGEALRLEMGRAGVAAVHLSITHERVYCVAAVVIEGAV